MEMIMRVLEGKNALVTGGSRGIGRAIAIAMATHGARVAVAYLQNDSRAQEVVSTIAERGGNAVALKGNLARPAEVRQLFDAAERACGPLDIVVASAADIMVKPLVECTEQDYDRIFDTNAKGVFFTLQEAARRVREGGRIIAISTGGTKMFFPGQSLYLGSKGAVEQFVRCLAWELGPRAVTVNAISPGPTETDMMQDRYRDRAAALSPFNRIGDPAEIADLAVFVASDAGRWMTGQNIGAGGGAF
jgi:3-oxoacyl-[acyl-carrier protein] reductase